MQDGFSERISRLPLYLARLNACTPIAIQHYHRAPNIAGIYALLENGIACYVGRTGKSNRLRKRLHNHQQPTHNQGSFVYKRTCSRLGLGRVYRRGEGGTRDERMKDPAFLTQFKLERDLLLQMTVRFVEIECHIDQYLFELYATLHFGLDTSGFDTH